MSRRDWAARLRTWNDGLAKDSDLDDEVGRRAPNRDLETSRTPEEDLDLESIVLRTKRPVLEIRGDDTKLVFRDAADSDVWRARLEAAADRLHRAARAVGRIEYGGGQWGGTGWLVDSDIIVTNRHVAQLFVRMSDWEFVTSDRSIDFAREAGSRRTRSFRIKRVVHVEPDGGPDIALFQVESTSADGDLAEPIVLAAAPTECDIGVIGFPADDIRIPDAQLITAIYGDVFDVKRLAPGRVTAVLAERLLHDATTLGGNSGSVLVDLDQGTAVGLHYSGRFLQTNRAVRCDAVRAALENPRSRPRPASAEANAPAAAPGARQATQEVHVPVQNADGSYTVSVPLTVTFSFGAPTHAPRAEPRAAEPLPPPPPPSFEDDEIDETEAPAESYLDRPGYLAGFLGADQYVTLPVIANADDVLGFEVGGEAATELKYHHYTVVMSASRRMCIYSAVNIDGAKSGSSRRTGWKRDPRIPANAQILQECYGKPPKFSRGHMTRREDPAWGRDADERQLGSNDSMHVTNTTPQMQAFNAPIWLALEKYALDNAREGDMKISVFTGPYFDHGGQADPVYDGVRVPRVFWKVIAFVHEKTGDLCATGYELSQEANLPDPDVEEEFVYGQFVSPQLNVATQVPIEEIGRKAGLDFGVLLGADPLSGQEAPVIGRSVPLLSERQIRFL